MSIPSGTASPKEASGDGKAKAGRRRHVRVAVVQIEYHPAFEKALFDPLFDPKRESSSLLPPRMHSSPSSVRDRFKALRRRVRKAYVDQMERRVLAIVDMCKSWGVEVLVLPEYSIPPELLEPLSERARDIVVVAGSHYVEAAGLEEQIYRRLGHDKDPELEQAVSPVLYGGKILALVPKLNPAKPELSALKRGTEWSPVPLPEELPGPMGVLVCLDYIFRSGDPHLEYVARSLSECRFLAALALTPQHSLPEFAAHALEDARRDRKPVLLANQADHGGSTIVVDEGLAPDASLFPEHAGRLDAGEEGVIVADIDLGFDPAGSSTQFGLTQPLIPFAAASLVYCGSEKEYAAWQRGVQATLNAPSETELARLKSIRSLVLSKPPPVPSKMSARKRRLERLMDEIDFTSRLTLVRQLTTELLLPEDLRPLSVLRAALARGAAAEIQRWVNDGEGEFGPVASGLRKEWEKVERSFSMWTPTSQEAALKVSEAVGPKAPGIKTFIALVDVFEEEVIQTFEREQRVASEHFAHGRYAQARDAYRAMLERAIKMVPQTDAAQRPKVRGWVARFRLNVALATLNLQEIDEGEELLRSVESDDLPARAKLALAEALALSGDRARARAVLPDERALAEADLPRLLEVRQTLDLIDGKLPDPLVDSGPILLRAALVLLQRGDLAGAAERALGAIDKSRDNALTRAFAAHVLVEALRATVFETPPDGKRIPVERRGVVVDVLETYLNTLRSAEDLPKPVRDEVRGAEFAFRALTKDLEALPVTARLEAEENDKRTSDPRWVALELALSGRVEEALRALPPVKHPWRGRLDRVEMLAMGKQLDRALEEAIALAHDFPGRAPVEYMVADLCAHQGRSEEALAHAELAFRELPGKGYRLLLAWQRLDSGQAEGAWELVKDLNGDRPLLLRAHARAAEETGRLVKAEKAWRRYVEQRPEDAVARVRLAQLCYRLHRPEEAAAVAWAVFKEHGDRLDVDALYVCGALQRLAGPPDAEQRRRVLDVAARMKERFHSDDAAEELRFQLVLMLGEIPEEAGGFNYDRLVERGTLIKGHGISELKEFVDQRGAFLDAVHTLARSGAIPTTTACALSGMPLALFVTRILERSRRVEGYLCPPVSLSDQPPPGLQLEGATILVSDLEFLLLEALDLFPALRNALGQSGKLCLFRRAVNRIREDFSRLRLRANPKELANIEALLRQIEHFPTLESDPRAPYDDVAAARKTGAFVIESEAEGVGRIAPKAFLGHIRELGCIDDEQYTRIERFLPSEPEPQGMSAPLPERIVLSWFLAEKLFEENAIIAVFEALGGRLQLGPRAKRHFQAERDDRADTVHAEKLAEKVHGRLAAGLTEGWIKEEQEPAITYLPPLREPELGWGQELVLEPLSEMLAYCEAVLGNPGWWRLSAEFYGSVSLGAPDLVTKLAWPSPAAYLESVQRLRLAASRDLTFPALVRVLELKAGEQTLIKLAGLGFPDALGAGDILRLERRYRGLEKVEPKRILDAQEWMTRVPGHLAGEYARLRLTQVYAASIFQVFFAPDRSPAERKALLDMLLKRQEVIGKEGVTNTLDATFALIASRTIDFWRAAWKLDGYNYVPDPEGPIALLWSSLSAWSGEDGPRRAARGRAVREVWRMLNQIPGGPPVVVGKTLAFVYWPRRNDLTELSLIEPEVEALAILSARWAENPFEGSEYEDALAYGVELLASNINSIRIPREIRYRLLIGEGREPIRVRVPMEALLLRSSSPVRREAAKVLKVVQGRD
ncbi:MAG: hypothetical protein L6Q76_08295, partial [Polyangiaceae bacterium]|nr:hypothetical protein [Polyangiaceae bacterium]